MRLLFHSSLRYPKCILLGLLLSLSALSLRAQYYITEQILINDGLSNNYVRDLTLDRKGRLWIATESGLNAYNGVSFASYNVANSSLSANMINCLWYDIAADYVWAGTKGEGICRIHPETGEVLCCNTPDSTLSNVLCITPAADQQLWLISPNDVMLLDPVSCQIGAVPLGQAAQFFRCGVDDGNGNLILGSYMHGAFVLNARTHQLTQLVTDADTEQRVKVNHVYKDHSGRIWLTTNIGLWYYQPGSSQLVPFESLQHREVFDIIEVDNRELWVTSNRTVSVINLLTYQVTPLTTEGEIELMRNIQCLYHDPHGNIWVGGQGSGLQFISHQAPFFRKLHNGPFWGIYADENITWAGSRGHLYGYEGTHLVHHFDFSSQGYGAVLAICGDGHDKLYLAVPYHFLTFDKHTGLIRRITTDDGRDIEALTFYREEDGTLWITATDGVYTFRDGRVTEMSTINSVLNRQSANGIRRDPQGKLWVATYENGLYLFDRDYHLICNLTSQSGFFSNSIQHLKFDSKGRLWMSTPDGPCCVPDTEHPGHYVSFGYEEGLRDTYVRAIQEDRAGNIWMSTNNGISMLRYDERNFVNYSQSDYIPVNNLSGGAVMQPDGGIVFTSMEGLCHCYPDSLTHQRTAMHIGLMSFVVFEGGDQTISQHNLLPDADGIYRLDHRHGSFQLIMGCQDYAQSRLLEFEYQMEGTNHAWIPCHQGIVTFRNLRPGTYKIKVRARYKGQPWSDKNAIRATVSIAHPWWSNWWARSIYIMLAVLIVVVLLRHYWHRLRLTAELDLARRRNMEEQQRNTERLHFFTNITHELKTPLTLIQAPLEEMLHKGHLQPADVHRLQLVYDSSKRLSDLCNKLLDFRRTETNNTRLKVSPGRISKFVQEVGQSFVELNTNPDLEFIIHTDPTDAPILFDPDVLRSILINLLSNAVKYTPKGVIRLSQSQERDGDQRLTVLKVSDTGYGISHEALPHIFDRYYQAKGAHQASGTGIGLAIVKSLAELHKATIKAESTEGMGTCMTLTIFNDELYPDALHGQGSTGQEAGTSLPSTTVEDSDDSKPIVLLVEDDYAILQFMAEALSPDYRILQAHNGQEGLDFAFSRTPDVIITDLMMPVMDGNTLCRTLKNDLRTSHIPIIMLTAKDTADDQCQGYADGADSYLTKPFSLQMLRTRLQNLLTARHRLAEWVNAHRLSQLPSSANDSTMPDASADDLPAISAVDQQFLDDLHNLIITHISDENIRMEDLATSLRISHSTLYRKVKALTGLSGTEYIRKVRILHSATLLRSGHYNVSEAAYACGFNSLPYFRTAFKDVFSMTPSEYLKQ